MTKITSDISTSNYHAVLGHLLDNSNILPVSNTSSYQAEIEPEISNSPLITMSEASNPTDANPRPTESSTVRPDLRLLNSSASMEPSVLSSIAKTNELLTTMILAMQSNQTELRSANNNLMDKMDKMTSIGKVVNHNHHETSRDDTDDEMEIDRAEPGSSQRGSSQIDNLMTKIQPDKEFSDLDNCSDSEEGVNWLECDEDDDEDDEPMTHSEEKCSAARRKMKTRTKNLTKEVKNLNKKINNLATIVNILTQTTVPVNHNKTYATATNQNPAGRQNSQYPDLRPASKAQNIFVTPAVGQIQKRPKPTVQTSEQRIDDEFKKAQHHIGFKPITVQHVNKEKKRLSDTEKHLEEEEQMDIVSKRLIGDFIYKEMGIPEDSICNILTQIVKIHPPRVSEPDTWNILYVEFASQNIVNRVWSYAPSMTKSDPADRENKIELKKYIPHSLFENYKFVEEIAFRKRRDEQMQTKIVIGNDRFILKCRSKEGQRSPWKEIPETLIDNRPKIDMSPRPRLVIQPRGRSPPTSPPKQTTTLLRQPSITSVTNTENPAALNPNDIAEALLHHNDADQMDVDSSENIRQNHVDSSENTKQNHTPPETFNPRKTKTNRVNKPVTDIGPPLSTNYTGFAVPPPPAGRQKSNVSNKSLPPASRQRSNTSSISNLSQTSNRSKSKSVVTPNTSPSKAVKIQAEAAASRRSTMTARSPPNKKSQN